MNVDEYLLKLNNDSQIVFKETIKFKKELGKAHHMSACIYDFSKHVNEVAEKNILETVFSQLEFATLNATLGMYRQAFTSLRLAFEMGLGVVYFSVHKLELYEWLDGKADIKWSSLIDDDIGVLTKRLANAFFKEFANDICGFKEKAGNVYRALSEFVHGNKETWTLSSINISYKEELLKLYFERVNEVVEIILYVLCCRYLKSLDKTLLDSLDFLREEMGSYSYIREYLGG